MAYTEAQKRHYQDNKGSYAASSKAARERKKAMMVKLKDKPCLDCGVKYPSYVMQWDHIGTDKVAAIGRMITTSSWQKILDEIAKCELVCANCHAERTHQRLNK